MLQYQKLLADIMNEGHDRDDRTGTGTRSIFGYQTRYDLVGGFPLVTTKRLYTKAIVHELLWFLRGDTNVKYLRDNGVTIWDEWADDEGNLGPVYGQQWRSWGGDSGVDQITQLVHDIKTNPDSRRLIVSAWNVDAIPFMALPPCHCMFQFYTRPMSVSDRLDVFHDMFDDGRHDDMIAGMQRLWDGLNDEDRHVEMDRWSVPRRYLDCQLYQRSADAFLGVPFNIASYALLTHMIAQVTGTVAGEFVHTFGDLHIYRNHFDQVAELLGRKPLAPPVLWLNSEVKNIDDFTYGDIEFRHYYSHPPIKAPVAV